MPPLLLWVLWVRSCDYMPPNSQLHLLCCYQSKKVFNTGVKQLKTASAFACTAVITAQLTWLSREAQECQNATQCNATTRLADLI